MFGRSHILGALLGGILGLSVALFLVSDRSHTAAISLPIDSESLTVEMSGQLAEELSKTNVDIIVTVDRGQIVLQTRGSAHAAEMLLSEVWPEARNTVLENTGRKKDVVDFLKDQCLASDSCLLTRDMESLRQEAEIRLAESLIPDELPSNFDWLQVGAAPSNPIVLAIGAGVGTMGGFLIGWIVARGRRGLESGHGSD